MMSGKAKLSFRMMQMLREVEQGYWDKSEDPNRPFQCSNTNRTADALEARGLIESAADQSRAWRCLDHAWVLTPAGVEALSQ